MTTVEKTVATREVGSRSDASVARNSVGVDSGHATQTARYPTGVGMVLTKSRNPEIQQHKHKQQLRAEQNAMASVTEPNPRGLPQVFGCVTYSTLLSYDCVPPG